METEIIFVPWFGEKVRKIKNIMKINSIFETGLRHC